jgi:hypothetical protein
LVVAAYVAALPHYSAWLHMWLTLPHYWLLLSVLNSPVQVHQRSKPSLEKC